MGRLLDKSSIIGMFLLVVGVIAGVYLVQQRQEFREKAGLEKERLIVVCHKNTDRVSWEEIEVTEDLLESHIDHGDLLGNCPESFVQTKETQIEQKEQETETIEIEESEKISLDTQETIVTDITEDPEITETPSITPIPTPQVTVINNDASFRFFLKIQGISAKRPSRLINVTLERSGSETHNYKNVLITPNSEGTYFGQLGAITSGEFDISFKTDSHLRQTFEDIKIIPGGNTWYFENNPLLAGDFNSDNVLDVVDIALLLAELNSESVNVDQDNSKFDVDVNARIDLKDLELVLENYNQISIRGD